MAKKSAVALKNNNVVTQSNQMINSKYNLTTLEQKMIMLAVSQIDSVNHKRFFRFSATISELQERLGVELNETRFKDFALGILKKPILFKKSGGWVACNWFSAFIYYSDEARVEFEMSPELKTHLLKLKELANFTPMLLENALKFSGKYTLRFYQFCLQRHNQANKKVIFSLDELFDILILPKTMKTFGQFKRNVLEPSITEINDKSDIKVKYEITGKKGKKITEITLSWNYKTFLEDKTKKASEAKNFAKYKGKWCLYLGYLCKIDFVKINEETKKLEAIYTDDTNEQCRLDFDSIEALNLACLNGKAEYNYRKANPEKFKKADCSEQVVNLFSKMF